MCLRMPITFALFVVIVIVLSSTYSYTIIIVIKRSNVSGMLATAAAARGLIVATCHLEMIGVLIAYNRRAVDTTTIHDR